MLHKIFVFSFLCFILFTNVLYANDTLVPYRKALLWGYSTYAGNIVIKPQYDAAKFFTNNFYKKKNYGIVTKKNKIGLVDKNNNIVIPFHYDSIEAGYDNGKYINCLIVKKNNKFGCINYQLKILLPCKYDEVVLKAEYKLPNSYENYKGYSFAVNDNGAYFVIHQNGKKRSITFDDFENIKMEDAKIGVERFLDDRIEEITNNYATIIQQNADIIDSLSTTRSLGASHEYIEVFKNKKVGIVRQEELLKQKITNILIPIIHDKTLDAYDTTYTLYNFLMKKNDSILLYKNNGTFVGILPTDNFDKLTYNYIITKQGNKLGYVEFDDTIQYIVPPLYDDIKPLYAHELFLKVVYNNKLGYINKKGLQYFTD